MVESLPMLVGVALAGINSVLLIVLASIWLRNYREFRSNLILGLVAFSGVLLLENVVAIYFVLHSMHMLYASDPLVGQVVVLMRGLQFLAVAFLTYVTIK
ncbi:MAG: hypothetical protein U5K37_11970 [Natrialbaceae archaeon]|nr:hypothetical protein [Natrialbaceae archaeon]